MPDAKERYSAMASRRKAEALGNPALQHKIDMARERKNKFKDNWQRVDLDELVRRFTPHATPQYDGVKVRFHEPGGKIDIVADTASGSCRLQDMTAHQRKAKYLALDGSDPTNYKTPGGKTKGRPKAEREALTHFLIKKKGEQ